MEQDQKEGEEKIEGEEEEMREKNDRFLKLLDDSLTKKNSNNAGNSRNQHDILARNNK